MKDNKVVHIAKSRDIKTLCSKDISEIRHHRYKWMHPYEAIKHKLIINNEKDMPTCPYCLHILDLMNINIEKNY